MRASHIGDGRLMSRNQNCNESMVAMLTSSSRAFEGPRLFAGGHGLHTMDNAGHPLYGLFDHSETTGEADDNFEDQAGRHCGKKRRLTMNQVKSLEMSFETESKLDPEKKNQLARDLGLQPRQIAVWFQNRRARFKNKQLERDYDALKGQFELVLAEKSRLETEVRRLKELLLVKDKECKKEENECSQITINCQEETHDHKDTAMTRNGLMISSLHTIDQFKHHEVEQNSCRTDESEVLDERSPHEQKTIQHYPGKLLPLERLYSNPNLHQLGAKLGDGYAPEELYSNSLFTLDEQAAILCFDWQNC
eukprot:c25966_g1_i1 orf=422-1342(-)